VGVVGTTKRRKSLGREKFHDVKTFLSEKRSGDTIRMPRIAWMQIELKFQQKISPVIFTFNVIGLTMLEFLNSLVGARAIFIFLSKKGGRCLAVDRTSLDSTL